MTADLIDSDESEPEKTQPPLSALRYATPAELYVAMPAVAQLTQHRPRESEEGIDFLMRLRASTTPEEAVTFTAFAALPKWRSGGAMNACGLPGTNCRPPIAR